MKYTKEEKDKFTHDVKDALESIKLSTIKRSQFFGINEPVKNVVNDKKQDKH